METTLSNRQSLEALAEAWGVLPGYHDLNGELAVAADEVLMAALRALGCAITTPNEAAALVQDRIRARWSQVIEPVNVVWRGAPATLSARLREPAPSVVGVEIELESGEVLNHRGSAVTAGPLCPPGMGLARVVIELPELPIGYHRVSIGEHRAWLFVAPPKCVSVRDARGWGVFMPHHALHSESSRGVGHLGDLRALGVWVGRQGGTVLGTLPMLCTFLDEAPYEPGPYAPVSRCAWSEQLLDVTSTPEFARCPRARQLVSSIDVQSLIDADHVAPARAWRVQWELLSELAQVFFDAPDVESLRDFSAWEASNPEMLDYARFRSATMLNGPWPTWTDVEAAGDLSGVKLDEAVVQTWRYAQFRTQQQLARVGDDLASSGVDLYLDLPVGVHADGWDAWRHQGVFARGVSAGAPPDPFFRSGQDWGFPPLHPEACRADGHRHFIACLRSHMRHARQLRLDHVMGLYRLYWVVPGYGAKSGVYVRYPAQEWFAVLCIESQRSGCAVVGENLGLVPPEVDEELERRGLRGMYVGQFTIQPDNNKAIAAPKPGDLACLNTHDTPTFTGWYEGEDLATHHHLGWIDAERAVHERLWRERQGAAVAVFAERSPVRWPDQPWTVVVAVGLYRWLCTTDASVVLVNLEDLWGEARPHNVPGTHRERPNWLRRSARTVEEIVSDPVLEQIVSAFMEARCAAS
ncbi:MAG: 4-alpha-glucanotransferase [Kiritimatiellia bacterium]|jgi:4-alpha-glucanotransferase